MAWIDEFSLQHDHATHDFGNVTIDWDKNFLDEQFPERWFQLAIKIMQFDTIGLGIIHKRFLN